MRFHTTALIALTALAATALVSCGASEASSPPVPSAPSAPAVGVAPVEERELSDRVELTGRIAAVESVEVRPRVSGYLEAPRFAAGALVLKDQVLFQIDARWHKATLEQREAEVQNAEAKLASAESENARGDSTRSDSGTQLNAFFVVPWSSRGSVCTALAAPQL